MWRRAARLAFHRAALRMRRLPSLRAALALWLLPLAASLSRSSGAEALERHLGPPGGANARMAGWTALQGEWWMPFIDGFAQSE